MTITPANGAVNALTGGNVSSALDEEAGGNPAQSRYCDTNQAIDHADDGHGG